MTTRDEVSAGTVDGLLLDSGHTDVPELRAALLSIASLAQMQVPGPGPELAAMLAGPRDELTRKRWLRRHRPTLVGFAVLAGMGLGVSGVAATSQGAAEGSGLWSIQELTTDWAPDWKLPVGPGASNQGGPMAWKSPLFLQRDQAAPPGAGEPADPVTPFEDREPSDDEVPATAPGSPAAPAAKAPDRAPGADAANDQTGKPGGGTPGGNGGEAASEEHSRPVAPQKTDAPSEKAATEPEADSTGHRGNNPQKGESGAASVDSALGSAVEPVNRWLKKFRP
ncbi:hypothetical protein [Arthrobacter sp. SPG23]|uniref:hypothetical protein n=1 Tax=Arthrobacter sp. SPG23 TaxID=1610703 RepID=UPI0006989743|nr:hypothetical protein [Arthrobacter sp. SPG23]